MKGMTQREILTGETSGRDRGRGRNQIWKGRERVVKKKEITVDLMENS